MLSLPWSAWLLLAQSCKLTHLCVEQLQSNVNSDARQAPATPAPGSPESFAQAASILGGLASGLKGMAGIPFSGDAASALDGIAKGLGSAGQEAAGKKPPGRLAARQVPVTTPAPGSPESYAQAASILGGLASGLKGMTGVPFGTDAAKALDGLAKGLGSAGQVAAGSKPPGRLTVRQTVPVTTPAPGSPESFAQAASILGGLASGLKGSSNIPFASDAASALDGIAKGLGSAGQAAKKPPGRMAVR